MLPKGSISRIHDYYYTAPRFKKEILRALREFFNEPKLGNGFPLATTEIGKGLFNEWLLYDFDLSIGQKMMEHFIATNPFMLKDEEMKFYKDIFDSNKYGIFEVLNVKWGIGLDIKDLQTGKIWDVKEFKATFGLAMGDVFFARIGKVFDHYELIGADTVIIKSKDIDKESRKKFMEDKTPLNPKITNEIYNSRPAS